MLPIAAGRDRRLALRSLSSGKNCYRNGLGTTGRTLFGKGLCSSLFGAGLPTPPKGPTEGLLLPSDNSKGGDPIILE